MQNNSNYLSNHKGLEQHLNLFAQALGLALCTCVPMSWSVTSSRSSAPWPPASPRAAAAWAPSCSRPWRSSSSSNTRGKAPCGSWRVWCWMVWCAGPYSGPSRARSMRMAVRRRGSWWTLGCLRCRPLLCSARHLFSAW